MADLLRSTFQQGLDFAVASLKAERAMVVYRDVGLQLGLNQELMWVTGEIRPAPFCRPCAP